MGTWTGLIWFRLVKGGGCCKHGHKPSGSMKCRDFLTNLELVSSSRSLSRGGSKYMLKVVTS